MVNNNPSALFFCSKFVRGRESEVVGRLLSTNVGGVEGLGGGNSPVAVDLVLNLLRHGVVGVPAAGGGYRGLVGEPVLDTSTESDGVTQDALEVFPTKDGFVGVVDSILQLLVAAGGHEVAGVIEAAEVERVLVVGRLPDSLGPNLGELLGVPVCGETNIEILRDFHVHSLLHRGLFLLVVFNLGLNKYKISC